MTPPFKTGALVAKIRTSGNARFRLFCLPFAGGGTTMYRSWAALFPPEIEICPIQMPGRECRLSEPPARHLTTLVQSLARGLVPLLDKPYALFGHSLGAVVAFETVRSCGK